MNNVEFNGQETVSFLPNEHTPPTDGVHMKNFRIFIQVFFFKIIRPIRSIEQKEFWQKWGLILITFQLLLHESQLCLQRALNCTYLMHYWFNPFHLIR